MSMATLIVAPIADTGAARVSLTIFFEMVQY
jgi:hypothetical protein